MTFRPKVPRETVHERIERQYKARMAFYDHIAQRTQAARDLIAKESKDYHNQKEPRIMNVYWPEARQRRCLMG